MMTKDTKYFVNNINNQWYLRFTTIQLLIYSYLPIYDEIIYNGVYYIVDIVNIIVGNGYYAANVKMP